MDALDVAWNEKLREFEVQSLFERIDDKIEELFSDRAYEAGRTTRHEAADEIRAAVEDMDYEFRGYVAEVKTLLDEVKAMKIELSKLIGAVQTHVECNEIRIDLHEPA